MQESKKAMLDGDWVVCCICGHKLGKMAGDELPTGIEIKCHSCKTVNLVDKPQQRFDRTKKQFTNQGEQK